MFLRGSTVPTVSKYGLSSLYPDKTVSISDAGGLANVSERSADRAAAAEDYTFVFTQLGPCPRIRK